MKKPVAIIGISGGSGSGKTYFAKKLLADFDPKDCTLIHQDNYYIDQSDKFDYDGGSVNFDHPSAIDFNLLGSQLGELKKGHSVELPVYDFASHTRQPDTIHVDPTPIILVDGILVLSQGQVRCHFTDSIFVATEESLRFERRLKRDVKERGRTEEGVKNQFFKQVVPMHDEFVEPSKEYASFVISNQDEFDEVLDSLRNHLKAHL